MKTKSLIQPHAHHQWCVENQQFLTQLEQCLCDFSFFMNEIKSLHYQTLRYTDSNSLSRMKSKELCNALKRLQDEALKTHYAVQLYLQETVLEYHEGDALQVIPDIRFPADLERQKRYFLRRFRSVRRSVYRYTFAAMVHEAFFRNTLNVMYAAPSKFRPDA